MQVIRPRRMLGREPPSVFAHNKLRDLIIHFAIAGACHLGVQDCLLDGVTLSSDYLRICRRDELKKVESDDIWGGRTNIRDLQEVLKEGRSDFGDRSFG